MIYTDVKHMSHEHNLKPESNGTPFKCDGCHEPGWGLRFRCAECNYDLHKDCALGAAQITHPFYDKGKLLRLIKRGPADTVCNACGKLAGGLVYYGVKCSLHPCCATLPNVLETDAVKLDLLECVHRSKCGRCGSRNLSGSKSKGWSYRSKCKGYHFHVSCVKDLIKDLVVTNWEQMNFPNTNMDIVTVVQDFLPTYRSVSSSAGGQKWSDILAVVLNLFFSIILGDPTGVTVFFVSLLRS